MKKVLALTGGTALLAGAGVWALGGWTVVGLSLLVPLFVVTIVSLAGEALVFSLIKWAPSFMEGFQEGINELLAKVAA